MPETGRAVFLRKGAESALRLEPEACEPLYRRAGAERCGGGDEGAELFEAASAALRYAVPHAGENGADGRRRSAGDEMFEVFWEQYHDMTQQPALDIEAARKAWGKLTLAEREEAVGNIEMYLCMLPSIDRARTALKYLQMKSFVLN